MKRLMGLALAAIVAGGTSALAADLPADGYVAPPAPAPVTWNGWYFSLHGGAVWSPDTTAACDCGPPDTLIISTNTGYRLGGAVGYDFNPNFALEGEVSWASSSLNTATIPGFVTSPLVGTARVLSVMANVIAAYPIGQWRPYVGAGAGFAQVFLDQSNFGSTLHDSSGTWAGQLIAGIDYAFANGATIGGRYRYMYVGATDYTDGGDDPVHIDHIQAHSAEVVLKVPFAH
jgi:opacity protein-like surface antigen